MSPDLAPLPAPADALDVPAGLLAPSRDVRVQLVRYALVGAPAFLADAGVLALLRDGVGVPLAAAVALASLAGSLVNYALCTRWVFPERGVADRRVELLGFLGVGLAGMGLNVAVVWSLATRLGIHYLVAKVVAALAVLATGFGGRKALLFRAPR